MVERASSRLLREERTVAVMVRTYCAGVHGSRVGLCAECTELLAYARQRVARCPFGANKPTCAKCVVHCFRKDMRARIRAVMRYAGPRMLFRHPVLAFFHLLDRRRSAPHLRGMQAVTEPKRGAGQEASAHRVALPEESA
ncbi:MAG: nitrous oxide-stimulated promoter family protein [Calditrichaeota bacterium]|nr:nitrous oxide-stimulated promoter family protein [Calditrichota bacterium]